MHASFKGDGEKDGDGENTKPRIVVIEISTVLNSRVGCSAKSEVTMATRGTHPDGVDSPDPFR